MNPEGLETAPLERTRVVTCINSLIRPQPWISWLIVACGFAAWAGIVGAGYVLDQRASGLREILGLRAGHATGLFAIVSLLAVTQLSFIILWYRIQSRKDFHGRYRIWIWSSITWALFFSGAVFGWHETAARWGAARLPSRLHGMTELLWLMPAIVLFGASLRLLSKEMVRTPVDRWLLRGAGGIAAISAILHIVPSSIASLLRVEIAHALASLWPLLLASALLHHARYVIHVTNEVSPHARRHSRLSPIVQQVWREVMSLGPSRTQFADAFSPQRLRIYAAAAGRAILKLGRFAHSLTRRLAARITRAAKSKKEHVAAPRRQEQPQLPVASTRTTDEGPRTLSKEAPRRAKSA